MLVLHNLLALTKFERSPPLTFPHLAFPVFDPFSWLSLFSSFSFTKYKTFIICPYLSHFPPFPLWLSVPFLPPILPISHSLFSSSPPVLPISHLLSPNHSPPILPSFHPLFSRSPPTPCSAEGEKGFQRFGFWLSKLTIYWWFTSWSFER